MPRIDCVVESTPAQSVRSLQLAGMFDVPPEYKLRKEWHIDLPIESRDWNIGLIVGPSGAGKSTILRDLAGGSVKSHQWPSACLLDDFPKGMSIKDIVGLLCAVGFSSPPEWMKAHGCLSNGEQFRVNVARAIAESGDDTTTFIDEFTSVVDRNVAQIASAAVEKAVRKGGRRLIVASCHYDIAEWLRPDWIVQPHLQEFAWSDCLQRPPIELQIRRVHHSAWAMFRDYHYLSGDLNKAAKCFCAFWNGHPVAFTAALPFVGRHKHDGMIWREHRTVCLPDYQGIGFGSVLSDFVGAVVKSLGWYWTSATSHPAMIAHRQKSATWVQTRRTSLTAVKDGAVKGRSMKRAGASGRNTSSFEYCGPAWSDVAEARRLWTESVQVNGRLK